MVIRPVVIAVICVGLFLILESLMLPKTMALKANDFMMQDQRPHKRRNYMSQRARDKEILKNLQKRGVSYDTEIEALDAAVTMPERLAYIVDYANTIDDEYFLDKSVETRTRKRGNIKVEKHSNQAIPDPPCSCDSVTVWENLEDNIFPRKIPMRGCRKPPSSSCAPPYECKEIYYEVPILKKKTRSDYVFNSAENLVALVPNHLNISWYAELKKLAVGCQCVNKYYLESNPQK